MLLIGGLLIGGLLLAALESASTPPLASPPPLPLASPPPAPLTSRPTPRRRPTTATAPATMPGPARGRRSSSKGQPGQPDRLARNDACSTCHADIATEWTHSLHRHAYDDPMFQAGLAREREPMFCQSCHAPEADPRHEPSAREAAAGVACVSCHLTGRDDAVLAGPDGPTGQAPHALRRSAAFASPDACADCHEFWFPGGHKLKMQRTITEHTRSAFAEDSCQTCHMPPTRSDGGEHSEHREHRFAVVGQVQMLRAAVRVEASRPSPDRVELQLSPGAVGHAVPTGDLFRRLSVELHTRDSGPPWSDKRVLVRRFGNQPIGDGEITRVERGDDRVGMKRGPTIVTFSVPPELHERGLRWELVLERALDFTVGVNARADIWDRTSFMTGEL